MDPEHFCDGGQAMDPCTGGTRTRKWLLDANMEYKMAAGFILPFENTKMNTGKKSPFEADFTQFAAGDRGESGIQLSMQGGAHVGYKNYRETIRAAGYSLYSAEMNRSWAGASDNDREEGWVWSRGAPCGSTAIRRWRSTSARSFGDAGPPSPTGPAPQIAIS